MAPTDFPVVTLAQAAKVDAGRIEITSTVIDEALDKLSEKDKGFRPGGALEEASLPSDGAEASASSNGRS